MMPIHGMKVTRLTSGDLTDELKSAANNCCEKSAEAIVDESNVLINMNIDNQKIHNSLKGRILM